MADVWIPRAVQSLTGGQARVQVTGSTVGQIIGNLEREFPGMKDALCDGDGIVPGIAVIVDGQATSMGLLERVREGSEVHFLPAIGGG